MPNRLKFFPYQSSPPLRGIFTRRFMRQFIEVGLYYLVLNGPLKIKQAQVRSNKRVFVFMEEKEETGNSLLTAAFVNTLYLHGPWYISRVQEDFTAKQK